MNHKKMSMRNGVVSRIWELQRSTVDEWHKIQSNFSSLPHDVLHFTWDEMRKIFLRLFSTSSQHRKSYNIENDDNSSRVESETIFRYGIRFHFKLYFFSHENLENLIDFARLVECYFKHSTWMCWVKIEFSLFK